MGVDDERAGTESRTVPRDDVAEVLTTYSLLTADYILVTNYEL